MNSRFAVERQRMTAAPTHYRPDIDGLRAVAVMAVVLHHLWPTLMPGGYVGVDVFFVISGYLITGIIGREMAEGRFSFRLFYERRIRRIFPALFSVLAATLFAGYFLLLPSDYALTLRTALATLFFASNIVFWRERGGYFNATEEKLNPLLHTWSLAVEEQFYLLFPMLLLFCHRYFYRFITPILLVCGLGSLGLAVLLIAGRAEAVFYLSPFRAWELLAGSLLALGVVPALRAGWRRETLAAGGLLAIVAASFFYHESTVFPGLAALVPVLGAVAIIHAGSSGLTLAGRLLQLQPVVYVGLISYSLYLWHWPVLVLGDYANAMAPLTPPLVLAVSLLLAGVSYRFIEQPFRRRQTPPQRPAFPLAAGVTAVLSFFCATGLAKDGYAGRFSAPVVLLDKARTPLIPYRECNERPPQAPCFLGRPEGQPDTLLWGDSHLLAWAPAMHESLMNEGRRAVFVPSSACPPLIDVQNAIKASCASTNAAIQGYLVEHPEIESIFIAAFWSTYFRESGPISGLLDKGELIRGITAAQWGLENTLHWMHANNRNVTLIGPVPVYPKSVPAALALQASTGRKVLSSTAGQQRERHAPFLAVVDGFRSLPHFRYLDPIQWLCHEECEVMRDGVALYRDSHHLSVAGALALKFRLSEGMRTTSHDEFGSLQKLSESVR